MDNFMRIFRENGVSVNTMAEREFLCGIVEKLCYVAVDLEQEMTGSVSSSSAEKSCEMPVWQ